MEEVYTKPIYYTKVIDQNGQVLLETHPETHTVIKSSTASLLTLSMEDTISGNSPWRSHGIAPTGELCQIPNMSVAGKSGSTTDHNDLWFVGYSPYVTCGIWSGYDESITLGSEGEYHKLIWQKVMAQIHEGKIDIGFEHSNELEVATICSKSGQLAVKGVCDQDHGCVVYDEYFARGTAPTTKCTRHVSYSVCEVSNKLSTSWCPKNRVENHVYTIVDPKDLGDDPCIQLLLMTAKILYHMILPPIVPCTKSQKRKRKLLYRKVLNSKRKVVPNLPQMK